MMQVSGLLSRKLRIITMLKDMYDQMVIPQRGGNYKKNQM
jgi:hypothetical protein